MQAAKLNSGIKFESDFLMPFALKLTRDLEDAKDLFQETIYKALTNGDKYVFGTNMKAWMYTIMRNIFINNYHRKSREYGIIVKFSHEALSMLPGAVSDDKSENRIFTKEIKLIINELPELFRIPFLMYIDGYKYKEIAELLGEPLGTVKSRIFFARKLLQEKLPEYTTK